MEKIWLKHYPQGTPAEIDSQSYQSVADALEKSCAKYSSLTAYANMGHEISYSELDRLSKAFAAYLQNELKLSKGDRIAVMMPNLLQYPVAIFGILRAGLVVVNVNPMYTARELEHQLSDSGTKAIVVLENFIDTVISIVDKTPVERIITTQVGDLLPVAKRLMTNFVVKHVKKMVPRWEYGENISFPEALKRAENRAFMPVHLTTEDTAFLQYTGGTTGLAKGAELTHGSIVANLEQAKAMIAPWLDEGKETVITALPLYHIFALTVNCLVFVTLGGKNVLITDPRNMPAFVQELGKTPFTVITGVNTLFNGLLNTPGFAELNFQPLKFALGGGAAVQQTVAQRWTEVTNKPLTEGYGLTETSPIASMNPLNNPGAGRIGIPVPSTDFSIRNDAGQELNVGEAGELCIKGPQVMRGYWNKPEENQKIFTADGYLRTGDIAVADEDGYFKIVDRIKDMILVSGFNVFPNEVEDVIAQHPGVLECACVGTPDASSGEAVKVFVVKKDHNLSASALRDFAKAHLTGYKVPKQFAFTDELPKSNVGKILRKELRNDVDSS